MYFMKRRISLRTKHAKKQWCYFTSHWRHSIKYIDRKTHANTNQPYVYSVFCLWIDVNKSVKSYLYNSFSNLLWVKPCIKLFFFYLFLIQNIWASLCFESKSFLLRRLNFSHVPKNRCIHAITISYLAHLDNTLCYQAQLNNKGCHFLCYMVITNIIRRRTVNSVYFSPVHLRRDCSGIFPKKRPCKFSSYFVLLSRGWCHSLELYF